MAPQDNEACGCAAEFAWDEEYWGINTAAGF